MARPVVRRTAVLFVLAVLLAGPWNAVEAREGNRVDSPQLWERIWSGISALWSDIGCLIDPSGRCRDNAASSNADIGCGIDPNGRCGS